MNKHYTHYATHIEWQDKSNFLLPRYALIPNELAIEQIDDYLYETYHSFPFKYQMLAIRPELLDEKTSADEIARRFINAYGDMALMVYSAIKDNYSNLTLTEQLTYDIISQNIVTEYTELSYKTMDDEKEII